MHRPVRWTLWATVTISVSAGAVFWFWFQGYFLPEPEIILPPRPAVKLNPIGQAATGAKRDPAPAAKEAPTGTTAPAASPVQSQTATTGQANPAPVAAATATPTASAGTQQPTAPAPTPATGAATTPAAPAPAAPAPPPAAAQPTPAELMVLELERIYRPELESLQTQCESALMKLADEAIAEYNALGRTNSAKATLAAKYLPRGQKLQTTCERLLASSLSSLETELKMNGLPLILVTQIRSQYAARVEEMKLILRKRAGI